MYVLDPKLQHGKKLPKWNPQSCRGQYLGVSPDHASTIGRILNISTGYSSPQYHVVYDDHFSSVPNSEAGGIFHQQPLNSVLWDAHVTNGLERILDPDTPPPPLHDDW